MPDASRNKIEENNKANIQLVLDIVYRKHETQKHAFDALEAKIGTLFGFLGIIIAGAIALLKNNTGLISINLFTAGLVGLFTSLLLLVLASLSRAYLDPPSFSTIYSDSSLEKSTLDLSNQVIADVKSAYEENKRLQVYKANLYNAAIIIFIVSLGLLLLGILGK